MSKERVFVRSHDGFQYLLSPDLLTTSFVESLFLLKGRNPVLVHSHSTNIIAPNENGVYEVEIGHHYVVFPAEIVENSDSEPEEYSVGFPLTNERIESINLARMKTITKYYVPRHPDIYKFTKNYLVPELKDALESPTNEKLLSLIKKETETGIYSLIFFTDDFCKKMIEEIESFENSGLPVNRPNSMNNYGLILNDIGMSNFCDSLVQEAMSRISALLYPAFVRAQSIDSHHSFIVEYKIGEDRKLDLHFDDSDVTMNICLGKEFEKGDLYFCGHYDDKSTHNENVYIKHQKGRAVFHLGIHRHAATEIENGERYNLIVWGRSHKHRENCQCGRDHTKL